MSKFLMSKATKIHAKDYTGYLWVDEFDAPFETQLDIEERILFDRIPKDEWPTQAWACDTTQAIKLYIDHILEAIESMSDEWPEGCEYEAQGLKELEKALDKFNEANAKQVYYTADISRVILLEYSPEFTKEYEESLEEPTE